MKESVRKLRQRCLWLLPIVVALYVIVLGVDFGSATRSSSMPHCLTTVEETLSAAISHKTQTTEATFGSGDSDHGHRTRPAFSIESVPRNEESDGPESA